MAEEKVESPTVEEPKETAEEPKPEIDVESLVAELEKAGISNPQELQGKLDAGTQAGRMAQLLGEERKRNEELHRQMEELKYKPTPTQRDDFDFPSEGQTVDLESVVAKSVEKVLTQREKKQLELQQKQMEKWNRIQGDESYSLVKDVWEEKLKDPNFVYKVQSGIVDPTDEYASTVREYYKGLLKQSHETIKQLSSGSTVKPPHMEQGERAPTNMVSESTSETPQQKRLKELRAKVDSGQVLTTEEELEVIDSLQGAPPKSDVHPALSPK